MTPSASDRLPSDIAERLHVYFASFLSPPAADEVMRELEVDTRGTRAPLRDVLRLAHGKLAARVDVPDVIELPVLIEDLGVPPDLAAHALGVPVATVERLAAEHDLSVRADPVWTRDATAAGASAEGTDRRVAEETASEAPRSWPPVDRSPAPTAEVPDRPDPLVGHVDRPPPIFDGEVDEDDRPSLLDAADPAVSRRGPRPERATRGGIFVVLGVLVAAVVAVALLAGGSDTSACELTTDRPVCVVEARLTHVIDASGNPGAPRSTFEPGEPVQLWFSYETLDPSRNDTVNYTWFHGDEVLYAADFPLPPVGRVNLTLAQAVIEQPGSYRVEVRLGDQVLVDETFEIAG